MDTIDDILDHKGTEIVSIRPSATIDEAVMRMCACRVGALLVCEEERIVGILSERDIMTRIVLDQRRAAETFVEEAMTRDVFCVRPTALVIEALAIMTEHRCRHLPVIDQGRLVGVVSIGDLVRAGCIDQTFEIQVLTDYITGAHSSA